ncbi:hypothetical protein K445DRAFT_321884 [Daldinia sp. EC12]|nr:hypothetical protein K445DRAFT_321884 [Daldinia sp. EC12]
MLKALMRTYSENHMSLGLCWNEALTLADSHNSTYSPISPPTPPRIYRAWMALLDTKLKELGATLIQTGFPIS